MSEHTRRMNMAIKYADDLVDRIAENTDNAADYLAGISLAVRRLQGYEEYMQICLDPNLRAIRAMPPKEEDQ